MLYFLTSSSTAEDKKCAISAKLQKHKEFDVDGIHHCLTYGDWEEFLRSFLKRSPPGASLSWGATG